jgi:5'-nucleotidase
MELEIPQKLTLLHFSDVYSLEPFKEEPVGGIERFKTAIDSFNQEKPLTFFSGDLFQYNFLSPFTRGAHMLAAMNELGITAACFGNHEFDLKYHEISEWVDKSNFPWVCSNVKMKTDQRPPCNAREYFIFNHNGFRIGILGLVEKEWIHTTVSLLIDQISFEEPLDCTSRMEKIFQNEQCDLIIALTHMCLENDEKLALGFTGLDLILGGHIHVYRTIINNGTYCVNSGSDFREFSKISITKNEPDGPYIKINIK